MDSFLALPSEERRIYCEQAEGSVHLPPATIEKDFWVCWTLRALFQLPEWGPRLTFKGGTSLSKGWKLIDRFSEDIDIVIGRESLGFGGASAPDKASSKKQKRERLEELKSAAQKCIREQLQPLLLDIIKRLPVGLKVTLLPDPADADQQTLLLAYPTAFPNPAGYLRQEVKIEFGARSDTEPTEQITVKPYLAEAFPNAFGRGEFPVLAVSPKRTFWEKVMLLHEETFRPPGKNRKARMARHYYDLYRLIKAGVARNAVADLDLFRRIAAHREVYFRYAWVNYATLIPEQIRLVPSEAQLPSWRSDYAAMKYTMFTGNPPEFDEIIQAVRMFQNELNGMPPAE